MLAAPLRTLSKHPSSRQCPWEHHSSIDAPRPTHRQQSAGSARRGSIAPDLIEPTGSQISARNAITHGACALNTLILPNESLTDYLALETRWMQSFRIDPSRPEEDQVKVQLIRTAARSEWFFFRAERNYSDTETSLFTETPQMADWTDDQHKKLQRVLRYRTANANLLSKHRKEIENYIKARTAEMAFAKKMEDNEARMAMAKERLEVFRQKNKPFDLAEELTAMKEKAIRLGFRPPDPDSAA